MLDYMQVMFYMHMHTHCWMIELSTTQGLLASGGDVSSLRTVECERFVLQMCRIADGDHVECHAQSSIKTSGNDDATSQLLSVTDLPSQITCICSTVYDL